MAVTAKTLGLLLALGAVVPAGWAAWPSGRAFERAAAQEQAPTRRDLTVVARDFRFSPDRIEVNRNDLVRLTVQSEDVAYSLTIDAYRVSRRVPAGGSVIVEFQADREGTFPYYSNLTNDARHSQAKGQLVVRPPR